MKENIDFEAMEIKAQLWGSFLLFCQTFYPLVTGRPFVISQPVGRESHFITIAKELTLAAKLETLSLLINVPPGHGKSVLISMWIAWTMSRYPDSQYLYISYGFELAAKHTEFIRRIIQCPYYAKLFDIYIRHDMKAKDHFMTTSGASVKAFGSTGPIVGQDAGLPNQNRFTGAILCFPYNQLVATEHGLIQIGEIVERKLNVRVWSYNFKQRKQELKPIINWYENPGSQILEIKHQEKTILRCTPNHEIYTLNRGWTPAKNLLQSDQLFAPQIYGALSYSEKICRFSLRNFKIIKNFKSIVTQALKFIFYYPLRLPSNNFSCVAYASISAPNFADINMRDIKVGGYFSGRQRAEQNCLDVARAKFSIRMARPHAKSTMYNCIYHIFRLAAITKVFNTIIKTITVFMPCFNTWRLRPKKSPSNQTMHKNLPCDLIAISQSDPPISFSRGNSRLFNPLRNNIRSPFVRIKNFARFLSNVTQIRDRIKPFISRDFAPLLIESIGHTTKTYCLNIEENHNFFCGNGKQAVLVSNCDDLHKPDEAHSDSIRRTVIQNYRETILQRPRSPLVPIIYIGQRLHEDDLPAFLLSGNDERVWKKVVLKALDDAGNALYPEVNPKEQLLEKKEKNPYVFSSQYQQEPVPAGGALYKEKDFPILDEEPEFLCTFITADTAETSKTYNDATVFSFWGVYRLKLEGQEIDQFALHWIDCWEMRIEPKELEYSFKTFYAECMLHKVKPLVAAIEKKSTGVTLCSVLEDMRGLEIREVKRTAASGSKANRYIDIQPIIAAKLISFTYGAKHIKPCIEHMLKITANDTHRHDDICDTAYDAIKIALIDKTLVINNVARDKHKNVLSALANDMNMKNRIMRQGEDRRI